MASSSQDPLADEPLDPLLEEAFGEYLDLRNRGEAPPPEEFVGRYPSIASGLRRCLRGIGIEAVAAPSPASAQHQEIGGYRLVSLIGRGGMGVVYEAVHPDREGHFALKILSMGAHGHERTAVRFRREAETLRTLDHPNIVPILDAGVDGDVLFYVMPLVEGISLDKVLAEIRGEGHGQQDTEISADETWYGESGDEPVALADTEEIASAQDSPSSSPETPGSAVPGEQTTAAQAAGFPVLATRPSSGAGLPLSRTSRTERDLTIDLEHCREVARLFAEICQALQHAHSRNVIHRDIKPGNLILSPERKLLLTDFGLAKKADAPSVTRSGDLVGTPMYMSPEQAMAKRVPLDHRTDIYSLGATAYECLALVPPFRGRSTADVLRQVISKDPVRLSRHNPNIPAPLEAIIHKAMNKDPDQRYDTAAQMGQEFENYLAGRPVRTSYPSWPRRVSRHLRRQPAQFALGIILTFVVLGALALAFSNRQQKVDPLVLYNRRMERLRTLRDSAKWSSLLEEARVVLDEPDFPPYEPLALMGQAQWHLNRFDEAYDTLGGIGVRLAANPDSLLIRAYLHAAMGAWSATLEDLALLPETVPPGRHNFRLQIDTLLAVGQLDQAQARITGLELSDPDRTLRARILLEIRRGNLELAGSVLKAISAIEPGFAGIETPLLLHMRGESTAALEALNELLPRLDAAARSAAQRLRGRWLLGLSPPRTAEALKAFIAALDLQPAYPAYLGRADALRLAGSLEEAELWIQRAAAERKGLSGADRLDALLRCDRGDLPAARAAIDRALDLDPRDPNSRLAAAWIETGWELDPDHLAHVAKGLDDLAELPCRAVSAALWSAALKVCTLLRSPREALAVIARARPPAPAIGASDAAQPYRSALGLLSLAFDAPPAMRAPLRRTSSGRIEWSEERVPLLRLEADERLALLRFAAVLYERLGRLDEADFLFQQAMRHGMAWIDQVARTRLLLWRGDATALARISALRRARQLGAAAPSLHLESLWLLAQARQASQLATPQREMLAKRLELPEPLLSPTERAMRQLAMAYLARARGDGARAREILASIDTSGWVHIPLERWMRALQP